MSAGQRASSGPRQPCVRIYRNFADFFEEYDVLLMPAASVLPFPNAQGEVRSIDGKPTEIDHRLPRLHLPDLPRRVPRDLHSRHVDR
ncbi:hypothetical protein ACH347_37165 [Saccharopolyspora sp. 5N102]|uniref:hypothetical protein n=1 Tax=Saccharopolyspora sp. 5N102 TaxID=3375155 RepID=UPI003796CF7B